MGDMADYHIEQGLDALALHDAGMCGEFGWCPYCETEHDDIVESEEK